VATCSEDIQHSRIFWGSFTSAERSYNEDRPDARPSCPDVDLLWKELNYSGKAIAKDRSDEAKFCSDANLPEYEIELK
jgi:hypothetical protein